VPHFVDREQEMAELNALPARSGAQFASVFGRRRIGKTTPLTIWAAQTGLPTLLTLQEMERDL